MFDKVEFNNLVISNKAEIQRARVLVVRKIINKIKKLRKTASGEQTNNEKLSIKLRKCLKICEKIKKIKPMNIIKHVLLLEKNPGKIMTNSRSTPNEVAVAMLAASQGIQNLKAKIYDKLDLHASNIEAWKPALLEMEKASKKKQSRKKLKKLKEMGNKKEPNETKKAKSKKELDVLKNNGVEEEIEEVCNGSKEKISIGNKKEPNEKKKTKSKKEVNVLKNNGVEEEINEVCNVQKEKIGTAQNSDTKSKVAKSKKVAKVDFIEKETKQVSDEEKEEFDLIPDITRSNKFNKKPKIAEYENRINVFKDNNIKKGNKKFRNEDEEDGSVEEPETISKFIGRKESEEVDDLESDVFKFKPDKGDTLKRSNHFKKSFSEEDSPKPKSVSYVDPFFKTETGEHYVAHIPVDPTYHPVTAHEKIVTNYESFTHPVQKRNERWTENKPPREKKQKFMETKPTTVESKTDLHPSWVAKQKLKPTIAAFQGKKITFDVDDE